LSLHDFLNFLFCVADNAEMLPPLDPQQALKLKQLTVMTLAETSKVIFNVVALSLMS
jgi:hypothetical protein